MTFLKGYANIVLSLQKQIERIDQMDTVALEKAHANLELAARGLKAMQVIAVAFAIAQLSLALAVA